MFGATLIQIGGVAFSLRSLRRKINMPKVGTYGEIHFPKGMSTLDKCIVQKVIDIRECEKNLLEVKQEILNIRKLLLNLQARQRKLENTISEEQDELFKLYDDKISSGTVAFNRTGNKK